MIYKTFDEWSAQGYRILKGSKGARSDKGTLVFSEKQVWKFSNTYHDNDDYDEDHFHGCTQWDLF